MNESDTKVLLVEPRFEVAYDADPAVGRPDRQEPTDQLLAASEPRHQRGEVVIDYERLWAPDRRFQWWLRDPTSAMRAEAASAGVWAAGSQRIPRLQLITAADIINGKQVEYPTGIANVERVGSGRGSRNETRVGQ